MRNKQDNTIEIFCPSCHDRMFLDINLSDQEQKLHCSRCGTSVYWHACPGCGTGYYDHQPAGPCPECTPAAPPVRGPGWWSLTCPWCRSRIPLGQILNRSIYITCPHCRGVSTVKGVPVLWILLWMMGLGLLLHSLGLDKSLPQAPLLWRWTGAVTAGLLAAGGSLLILKFSMKLAPESGPAGTLPGRKSHE